MSLCEQWPDGYYDDNGEWQRTKFCFVSCGAACTCMPPGGQFYSAEHDKRKGADRGSSFALSGGGSAERIESRDGVHMPVETTDAPPKGA